MVFNGPCHGGKSLKIPHERRNQLEYPWFLTTECQPRWRCGAFIQPAEKTSNQPLHTYIAGCFSQGTDPPVSRFFHWEKVPHLQPLDFSLQPVTAFSALCWLNQHLCWSAGWVVSERGYTTSHYHYHSLWMVRMHELRICMKTYHFLHKFWPIFAFFSILQGITIIIRPHKTMQTTKMN